MKTLLASALILFGTMTAAFAGGHHQRQLTNAVSRHNVSVWDDNTVVFAYNVGKGATYHWQQEVGPSKASLQGSDTPTLLASHLQPGNYIFAITETTAEGQQITDRVVVMVKNPDTIAKL